MLLVIGLGNPGESYQRTRHNIGFAALDMLREVMGLPGWTTKLGGQISRARVRRNELILLKPMTFMNRSGQCVGAVRRYFRLPQEEILVVHDELDLPLGSVRLKRGGGHAGHNGLRSISEELRTQDFARIRLGIGKPAPGVDVVSHVLGEFGSSEMPFVSDMLVRAVDGAGEVLVNGVSLAANFVNRRGCAVTALG